MTEHQTDTSEGPIIEPYFVTAREIYEQKNQSIESVDIALNAALERSQSPEVAYYIRAAMQTRIIERSSDQ